MIQFLDDPYGCKLATIAGCDKEKRGRIFELGSFNKISKATKRTRRDCCKFFYDNMSEFCFFDLLDELDEQYDKDCNKGFKTAGGCSAKTTRHMKKDQVQSKGLGHLE